MKSHYCEAEGTVVEYEGECNWCGEEEMTPKERAVMKQALEALENAYENGFLTGITGLKTIDIITALREALAEQAEQEPIGEVFQEEYGLDAALKLPLPPAGTKLYAAPVRTKDLTDDEIAQAVGSPLDEVYLADFRAVIAADRKKNK